MFVIKAGLTTGASTGIKRTALFCIEIPSVSTVYHPVDRAPLRFPLCLAGAAASNFVNMTIRPLFIPMFDPNQLVYLNQY